MLKIKDSVDLKELEKFGFIKNRGNYITVSATNPMPSQPHLNKKVVYQVFGKNRKLRISKSLISHNDLLNENKYDLLYDLIKADMVEKVEE